MFKVINHDTGATQEFKMFKKMSNECGIKEAVKAEMGLPFGVKDLSTEDQGKVEEYHKKIAELQDEMRDAIKFCGKFVYKSLEIIKE